MTDERKVEMSLSDLFDLIEKAKIEHDEGGDASDTVYEYLNKGLETTNDPRYVSWREIHAALGY